MSGAHFRLSERDGKPSARRFQEACLGTPGTWTPGVSAVSYIYVQYYNPLCIKHAQPSRCVSFAIAANSQLSLLLAQRCLSSV